MRSPLLSVLGAIVAAVLIPSCAGLEDMDDDVTSQYRGIEYEKAVMAGKAPRDPSYLQEREPVFFAPVQHTPDNSWANWSMPAIRTPNYNSGPSLPSSGSFLTSSGRGSSGSSSFPSQPRYGNTRGYTLSSDYRSEDLLGGGRKTSDRWGNSVTTTQGLDGRPRYTTSSGVTYRGEQTLGGGYRYTGSNGTSYTREQNLDGSYQLRGSDGRVTRREQTLGGGYRYTTR